MGTFTLTDEEKKKISESHKNAVKSDKEKKEQLKKGLQKPKSP